MNKSKNFPVNPLVRLIKIKKGFKEKINIVDNHIELTIQLMLYASGDKFFDAQKLIDHTPLILVLSIVEEKKKYELMSLPKKSKTIGLFGLNLNLLFSTDDNNKIIHELKIKILTLYHMYISPTSGQMLKASILKELKEILVELILIDATKKVFYQSPFFTYQYKYILFAETMKNDKEINNYKKFLPSVDLNIEIPIVKKTP